MTHDELTLTRLLDAGFLRATLDTTGAVPACRQDEVRNLTLAGHGILLIEPVKPADDCGIVLSAGIHGDETAPVELLDEVVGRLLRGELVSRRAVLLILGNPPALRVQRRHLQENLNRLFSSDQSGISAEAERARLLMEVVSRFGAGRSRLIHFDMHTAIRASHHERFALYPCGDAPADAQYRALCLLQRAGIQAMVRQTRRSPTFSGWTRQRFGALSFTLELGRVAPFGHNDLSRLNHLRTAIEELIGAVYSWGGDGIAGAGGAVGGGASGAAAEAEVVSATTSTSDALPLLYEVAHEIVHSGPGFVLEVADDTPNFTPLLPGTPVWHDNQQSFRVADETLYLLFPNPGVGAGQRAGLLVRSIANAG